jgi:Raf kinase inhibitor-like YbhB/YbcL family protein
MLAKAIGLLIISSPAFVQDGQIPDKYSCNSDGVNPPLVIGKVPEGTRTLAIIAEDPDAPSGTVTHWLAWDIQPAGSIGENTQPGVSGLNTKGKTGFLPLCPPDGSHRYYFHVYALDASLDLPTGSDRKALEAAMADHILAKGTLMGHYGKKK